MKLTPEQQEIVISKLSRFAKKNCSVCNNSDLEINESIFELREYQGGNLNIGGESVVFPVIPLSCKTCGYVQLFSAVLLGAMNVSEQK